MNLAPTLLETPRLLGEPMAPEHRDELIAILGDPRVGATLGGAATSADVDRHIAGMQEHWEELGFGWYAFRDRATGAIVGRGGPHVAHVAGHEEVEIGWTVAADRWGEGSRPSSAPRRSRSRSARSASSTSSRSRSPTTGRRGG